MMGQRVTIYALCDLDGRVRYIGKTVGTPTGRLSAHIQAAKSSRAHLPSAIWIRNHIAAGTRPLLKELEHVAQGSDWAERERYWIARYRKTHPDLLNLTDGGEGLSGHKQSAEHRQKIRAKVIKGAQFTCEQCSTMFWRKPYDIKLGNCRFCSKRCYQRSLKGIFRPLTNAIHARGVDAAAIARRSRTHCKRGHPLSGDNLKTIENRRICKACRVIHKIEYRKRIACSRS
ncbi:GIY-YIG nuclease family protein [Bradyrhizobium liaoningense]